MVQTRLSEAQSEMNRRELRTQMLILFFMQLACSSNPRGWNSSRLIIRLIRFERERSWLWIDEKQSFPDKSCKKLSRI